MTTTLPTRTRLLIVYAVLLATFAAGVFSERLGILPGSTSPAGAVFEPFWEAWHLVDQRYVDRSAVEPKRMTRGAIRGMLASLGDVGHTAYLTPDEFTRVESDLKGKLYGIGARLTIRKGQLIILYTFPNSPARKGGLLPGDKLVAVDQHDIRGLPLQKVVELVRGEPGTSVQLRVLRQGASRPVDLSIQRGEVSVPAVTWHLLPGTSVAHIAIQDFGSTAQGQLQSALEEATAARAKALIIDVRGNGGGLKDQAVAVTSQFLQSGTVFLEQDAQGKQTPVPVNSGAQPTALPLSLLIDEGTASSAEIFAGAIQDHGRGKLVGTRTFGTGTVLQPYKLSDGSVILLAVAEWLTPNGRKIWHQGIVPDADVTLPDDASAILPEMETNWTPSDLAKTTDRQLQKALELVKKQVP